MRPSISLLAVLLACNSAEPAPDPPPVAAQARPEPASDKPGKRESEPAPADESAPDKRGKHKSEPAPAKEPEEGAGPEPLAPKEDGGELPPAEPAEPPESAPGPREAAVDTKVVLGDGTVLRIGAEDGDPKSILFVEAKSVAADPSSPPAPRVKDLRKTTGEVVALQAAHDGKTLWVAWRTSVPGKDGKPDRALVAVAGFDAAFKLVGKAATLRSFNDSGDAREDGLALLARAKGGAAVAFLAGRERCYSDVEEAMTDGCERMQFDMIAPDGAVAYTVHRAMDGGDGAVDDMVEVSGGVVAAFHNWRGGPNTAVVHIADDGTSHADDVLSCGYPPQRLEAVGDDLVSICPDPGDASEGMLTRVSPGGALVAPSTGTRFDVPIESSKSKCVDGKRVDTLRWSNNGKAPAGSLEITTGEACP